MLVLAASQFRVTIRSPIRSTRTHQRNARQLVTRGAVLDRPGIDLTGSPDAPSTETGRGSGDTDKSKGTGGGSFRVILLASEKHTKQRCVQAITTVIPGIDESRAENCYVTAQSIGMALVTVCLKEHAEFYCQQLFRYGCRSTIEPDTTVL